jgi:hypothetical protein
MGIFNRLLTATGKLLFVLFQECRQKATARFDVSALLLQVLLTFIRDIDQRAYRAFELSCGVIQCILTAVLSS